MGDCDELAYGSMGEVGKPTVVKWEDSITNIHYPIHQHSESMLHLLFLLLLSIVIAFQCN